MSSHEIAELCGKEHCHVIRGIRTMLVSLYDDENLAKFTRRTIAIRTPRSAARTPPLYRKFGMAQIWAISGMGLHDSRGYVSAFYLDREHTIKDLLSWAPAEWLDLQAPRREL